MSASGTRSSVRISPTPSSGAPGPACSSCMTCLREPASTRLTPLSSESVRLLNNPGSAGSISATF